MAKKTVNVAMIGAAFMGALPPTSGWRARIRRGTATRRVERPDCPAR